MSNILDNLRKILTSRYGRDVRQAIHDGILNCYEDGKAGAIDITARDAIQAEAVTRENEDNALDERVQALEAGGAGLSDLTYEAWAANPEQYEAEDKGYIVPMQEMTPEGEKIFLFDSNDIPLDEASKSVFSSTTTGGALREINSKLNGLIKTKIYNYEYEAVTATLGGRAVTSPAINVSMDGYTPIGATIENSNTAYINASCLLTGNTLYVRGYASATNIPAGNVTTTVMYVKKA